MHHSSSKSESVFWRLQFPDGRGYLIPLQSSKLASRGLSVYNAQGLKAKLLKQFLKAGLGSGILPPFLPKFSPSQAGDSSGGGGIDRFLLDRLAAQFNGEKVAFAVSLGTPGAHRKPVIQIMDYQGEILGYAKIAGSENTIELIENEADTLRSLSRLEVSSFIFPRLIHSGRWNGSAVCIQSSPGEKSRPAPKEMVPAYLAILKELAEVNPQQLTLDASGYWKEILNRSERLQNPYYAHVLEQGILKIQEWVGKEKVYFHFRHGDFASWNMKRVGAKVFIFDWEYASPEAPAGWDLFHFWVQTLSLLRKWKPGKIYRAFEQDERFRRSLIDYLQHLGLDHQQIHPLLLLYLLERLSFYAAEDPGNFSALRPLAALTTLLVYRDQLA